MSTSTATVCRSCELGQLLDGPAAVGAGFIAVESCHAECEQVGSCTCGCAYSRGQACPDCRRTDTKRRKDGRCSNRRACARALAAFYEARRADREARKAAGVSRPARRREAAGEATKGSGPVCLCCGEPTRGGRFLPGHDGRFVSALVARTRSGEITIEEGAKQLAFSEHLTAKYRKQAA